MKKVILYTHRLNSIGGVETFVQNFALRMHKLIDLTVLISEGDNNAMFRLSDYCPVMTYHGQQLECDTLLLASAWGTNPEDTITADRQIQMAHADYDAYIKNWNFTYTPGSKTTHHVAVGQHVANSFEKVTPHKIDKVIYNLLSPYTPGLKTKSDKLRLVTLSRISKEKGFDRMIEFARKLKEAKIDFIWDVYGDISTPHARRVLPKFPRSVKFHGVTHDRVIEKYDYLVQLSDTEGMPYCILEALQARTPVISTDYPSVHELIRDGKNGHILKMDLSNFDKEKILKIPILAPYIEKSTEADWLEIL